ncbi:hypothetical protein JTB14_012787 [Gonioctena quinquepunctata]|nr:hypothetical protein JTB14_012787 [Gonioctena quinquepunctata]
MIDHLNIATEIFDLQLRDIKKVKIKGINKLGVEFCTPESANKFVNNESLKNRGYIMYIPQNYVTCKGIIRNVSKYLSIDRIKAVTQSPFQILDAKRLNRRVVKEDKTVEYVTTSTLLVTFEGVILPRYVTMSYLSMPVIPYIQPVMQCFSCLEFGHTKRQCRSTNSKCHNCSTAHESEVICTKNCKFCHSSEHNSLYKKCPCAYENISYFDAKELVPKMYDAGIDEAPQAQESRSNFESNITVVPRISLD